jgi:hypothetical protein
MLRAVRAGQAGGPPSTDAPPERLGALGNSARVEAFRALQASRARANREEAEPWVGPVVGPPSWTRVLETDPVPLLAGTVRSIARGDAVLRDERFRPVQPAERLRRGTEVDVVEVRHLDGRDYALVRPHLGVEEYGPAREVWIERGNLSGEAGYRVGTHAAWSDGRYLGEIGLVTVKGHGGAPPLRASAAIIGFLEALVAAAAADGIALELDSAFRSYPEQQVLYDRYHGDPDHPVAVPGSSNHQDGAAYDIDVQTPKLGPFGTPDAWTDAYRWMCLNAWRFGFVRTVRKEPWHWEYRPGLASESEPVFGTRPRLLDWMALHPDFLPYPAWRPTPSSQATSASPEEGS